MINDQLKGSNSPQKPFIINFKDPVAHKNQGLSIERFQQP